MTDQQFREIANVLDLKDGTTATVILIEDGHVGLDLNVDLPRPRQRASARLAAVEEQVLNRVLSLPELPPLPEPISPLPTQLRWAL